MTLLEPHNLPFLIGFCLLALLIGSQLAGLGDIIGGDTDLTIEADLDGSDGLAASGMGEALATLLGLGRVPLLIWLACLFFVFSTLGVIGQSIAASLAGSPLPASLAALAAAIAAFPLNGLLVRPLGALVPQDETSAVGLESLVRRDATIQIGTAKAGSPARAKVIDRHGQPHFVMVEPHDESDALREGDTVLLVRREGHVFYGMRLESPLLGPE